jgi:hypothetical protein
MERKGERNVETTIKGRDKKNGMDECNAEGGEEEGRRHFVLLMTITITTMMIIIISKYTGKSLL